MKRRHLVFFLFCFQLMDYCIRRGVFQKKKYFLYIFKYKFFLFWCRMQIMEGIKYVHRLIGYPLYTVQCRVMDVQKCSTWYSVAHKRWDLISIRIRLDWNIIDLWSFYRFYIFYIFYILFWTDNEYCMHCIHHATEPCSVWLTTPLLQNMDYI